MSKGNMVPKTAHKRYWHIVETEGPRAANRWLDSYLEKAPESVKKQAQQEHHDHE